MPDVLGHYAKSVGPALLLKNVVPLLPEVLLRHHSLPAVLSPQPLLREGRCLLPTPQTM